jgi:hypothetical protein
METTGSPEKHVSTKLHGVTYQKVMLPSSSLKMDVAHSSVS